MEKCIFSAAIGRFGGQACHDPRRSLASTGRPEMSPRVPQVRRLSAAEAREDLEKIIGGGDGASIGEPVIIQGLARGWRAEERWCSAEASGSCGGLSSTSLRSFVSARWPSETPHDPGAQNAAELPSDEGDGSESTLA